MAGVEFWRRGEEKKEDEEEDRGIRERMETGIRASVFPAPGVLAMVEGIPRPNRAWRKIYLYTVATHGDIETRE